MKIYNRNQIVSIDLIDERLNEKYSYYPEYKGILGLNKMSEGIYEDLGDNRLKLTESIPDKMFKKGNALYDKCKIVIRYSNNETQTLYFNSHRERDIYVKKEFNEQYWKKYVE